MPHVYPDEAEAPRCSGLSAPPGDPLAATLEASRREAAEKERVEEATALAAVAAAEAAARPANPPPINNGGGPSKVAIGIDGGALAAKHTMQDAGYLVVAPLLEVRRHYLSLGHDVSLFVPSLWCDNAQNATKPKLKSEPRLARLKELMANGTVLREPSRASSRPPSPTSRRSSRGRSTHRRVGLHEADAQESRPGAQSEHLKRTMREWLAGWVRRSLCLPARRRRAAVGPSKTFAMPPAGTWAHEVLMANLAGDAADAEREIDAQLNAIELPAVAVCRRRQLER